MNAHGPLCLWRKLSWSSQSVPRRLPKQSQGSRWNEKLPRKITFWRKIEGNTSTDKIKREFHPTPDSTANAFHIMKLRIIFYLMKLRANKKVLLRERKRHTARRAASTRCATVSREGAGGGEYSHPACRGKYHPSKVDYPPPPAIALTPAASQGRHPLWQG